MGVKYDLALRLPSLPWQLTKSIVSEYRAGARHFIFDRDHLIEASATPLWNEFQKHAPQYPGDTLHRRVLRSARFLLNAKRHRFFTFDAVLRCYRQGRTDLFREHFK